MIKKYFIFAVLGAIILSCGQQTGEKTAVQTIFEPAISELLENPMEYEGEEVRLEGIISHVCKHSGDKMRVMQTDTELSILVMLGDYVGEITPENEGQTVVLNGLVAVNVKNIGDLEETHEHDHEGEEHEEDHECASTEEAIEKMIEKGLDPDLQVVVDLKKYELK
jgi:hypothetical protein